MKHVLVIAIILAGLLAACAAYAQGGVNMVLKSDFEIEPTSAGWSVAVSPQETAPTWATGPGHSGQHYLEMNTGTGKWQSPLFTPTPLAWYRADFWYRAHSPTPPTRARSSP